ncbi:hypothetical protein NRA16_17915, partial [Acinetobacter baumannii]|nr:hypothetical protein [Acinetobacter baumannii]
MATVVHPPTEQLVERPAPATPPPPTRRRRGRGVGSRSPAGPSWGLIPPPILTVTVVSIFPIAYAFNLSLHETSYMQIGDFVGLQHFLAIFTTPEGLGQIGRSLIYVIGSLVIAVPLSLGLANLLNQHVRFRAVWRVLILLPWVVSQTVAA